MLVKISHYQDFGGVAVPVSEKGQYLDWRTMTSKKAHPLVGPYGPGHFCLGDQLIFAQPDFCELPDGNILVTAVVNASLVHPDDLDVIKPFPEVMKYVWTLTERVIEALRARGTDHDVDLHNCDEFYFLRCVGRYIGHKDYAGMDDWQLRGL